MNYAFGCFVLFSPFLALALAIIIQETQRAAQRRNIPAWRLASIRYRSRS